MENASSNGAGALLRAWDFGWRTGRAGGPHWHSLSPEVENGRLISATKELERFHLTQFTTRRRHELIVELSQQV